jgi:2,4-dienoyl-CoA reductase-like NADH-dependent reductase (Old Yellow Enzyme family)
MASLFDAFALRGIKLRNRIGVSPMCQYSSVDGFADDWHLVHLGSRAVGGAALVLTEATAVSAAGRISPADLGIYDDGHVEMLSRITRFIASQGAVPGMQLAHAGRKASTRKPWEGGKPIPVSESGWEPLGPSAIPFDKDSPKPRAMDMNDMERVKGEFRSAAARAHAAGFSWIELHAAHGYLLHSFLSPISNQRTDRYGGSFENRIRFPLETIRAVRESWPADKPLTVRLSCTDWVEGGWDIDQTVALSLLLKEEGVDLIDCSSGGTVPHAVIPVAPGYQVPFSARIRQDAGIATSAVGLIARAEQAEEIISKGEADLVFLAREFLRDPYWPIRHAKVVDGKREPPPPIQYGRAFG